jgi:hypothetical protein
VRVEPAPVEPVATRATTCRTANAADWAITSSLGEGGGRLQSCVAIAGQAGSASAIVSWTQ